jgi:excisionase family DNA binding protein
MERLLTIDQVADLLQMTPRFVEQQIRLDYLEAVLIGTEWRIEPAAVE